MSEYGILALDFDCAIVAIDHQPAEPRVGVFNASVGVEGVKFYDDGELITYKPLVDALTDYCLEKHGAKLEELAEESFNDQKRDIEDARAESIYEDRRVAA